MKILLLLASLLNAECDICSEYEQKMILSTVLNRSRVNKESIETVIFKKGQYHGIDSKNFYPTIKTQIIAAQILMSGPIDSSVLYFHANDGNKRTWIRGLKLKKKLKYHSFYKN